MKTQTQTVIKLSDESLELAKSVNNVFYSDEDNSFCFINTYKVYFL